MSGMNVLSRSVAASAYFKPLFQRVERDEYFLTLIVVPDYLHSFYDCVQRRESLLTIHYDHGRMFLLGVDADGPDRPRTHSSIATSNLRDILDTSSRKRSRTLVFFQTKGRWMSGKPISPSSMYLTSEFRS